MKDHGERVGCEKMWYQEEGVMSCEKLSFLCFERVLYDDDYLPHHDRSHHRSAHGSRGRTVLRLLGGWARLWLRSRIYHKIVKGGQGKN